MSCPQGGSTTIERPHVSAIAEKGFTEQVRALTNLERRKAGLSPLRFNAQLAAAAQAHSEDMARHRRMSHVGSNGSTAAQRIKGAGYRGRTLAENVANGHSSPEAVVSGWMRSPGHRKNILNPAYQEIGVGYANDYWTQNFGRP